MKTKGQVKIFLFVVQIRDDNSLDSGGISEDVGKQTPEMFWR